MSRRLPFVCLTLIVAGFLLSSTAGSPEPRRLTSMPGWEGDPALSPDGTRIAFSWYGETEDNWDIYVQEVQGGKRIRLTSHGSGDFVPAWSPDGKKLAFVRGWDQPSAIYSVPAGGGEEEKLLDLKGPSDIKGYFIHAIAWSPDGKSIAFGQKERTDKPSRIFTVSLESKEVRPLTSPPDDYIGDASPDFSPDGKKLVFVRARYWGMNDLFVQNLASGEVSRLTEQMYKFCWKPNWIGEEIIYSTWNGVENQILRVPVKGGEPREIPGLGESPRGSSASGGRLVYESATGPGDMNVWTVATDPAAGPREIISSKDFDGNVAVAPDGSRIVFGSTRVNGTQIWMADPKGKNPVQLTDFDSSAETGTARWSPDGSKITLDSQTGESRQVFLLDPETKKVQDLTKHSSDNSRASWARDGKAIYFTSNRSGDFQIWKMKPDGSDPVQVTRKGGSYAVESHDGKFLYYGKEDGKGIWKVLLEGGEETLVLDRTVQWNDWALARDGIYFATMDPYPGGEKWTVEFLSLETGKIRKIREEKGPNFHAWLAVSPDGKTLYYSQLGRWEADLMWIEDLGAWSAGQ